MSTGCSPHQSNGESMEDMGYESNVRILPYEGITGGKVNQHHEADVRRKWLSKLKKRLANGESVLIISTVLAVFMGILIGYLLGQANPSSNTKELIKFPGEILMRGLKMMIIPIITTSIVTGLANLDMKNSGRVGGHAMVYYITTTTIAVILGIALVSVIHPGNKDFSKSGNSTGNQVSTLDTYLDLIRNILPENIIAACFELVQTSVQKETNGNVVLDVNASTNGSDEIAKPMATKRVREMVHTPNVLGLITFFVAFGVTLSSLGEKGKPLTRIFEIMNEIFMKMITVIIWYSPIGICFLIASNVIELGSIQEIARTLGMYMVTVCAGLFIHGLMILPLIYFIFTRQNPYKFAYRVLQPILTALGTSSSAATLPITMRCLEDQVGIDERITKFVVPIGATMNMDGTALLEGVAAITIAQMHGIPLGFGQILTISITATIASIGAAAIPSAGLVTLILVLTSIGIPTQSVALLWSIDWLLDRLRTSVNVFGDCIGAAIVYHKNKHLFEKDVSKMEMARTIHPATSEVLEESTRLMKNSA